ncbi:MAG: putative porin [Acidobacteria bacterium]|nr:putative porin [Acidobacteriota bacterium]
MNVRTQTAVFAERTTYMRQMILRAAALCALVAAHAATARAQTPAPGPEPPARAVAPAPSPEQFKPGGGLFALEDVRRQLREQREELEQLRAAVREQSRLIGELRSRVEEAERATSTLASRAGGGAVVRDAAYAHGGAGAHLPAAQDAPGRDAAQGFEGRVARAEEQAKKAGEAVNKQLGNMTFGGDLRLRYESLVGQQNAAANPDNPGAFGNALTSRHRMRLRARFGVRGRINEEFEWGLRFSSGSFADVNSTNQTLTDLYSRKPFMLDHAYVTYRPRRLPGLSVQGGKFDASWTRTEMTWDNDVAAEGLMETYEREFKKSAFKSFALQAWQLPALDRNAAFVLGADGRVDLEASGRAGRDLALFGAQARTEFAPWKRASLQLSASDLYWMGTQFITPAQVFGPNVSFPVAVVIPASGTSPARTVTTQVSIPRDMLVTGNANLGFSTATSNAINRDGRLSSGFNMVDLIARLDLTHSARWPVMLLFDFVTNTRTRDVVTAGPGGADLLLRNNEGQGYWVEGQVGKDVLRLGVDKVARGDAVFNYTFMRIEKDAVLTPFNFSDVGQQSDVRAHRFTAAYAVDPRVTLSLTGLFTQRPNGLLGVFGQTPPGSLNRTLTRIQLDTILRF